MENVKNEFLELSRETPYFDEILCNCNMVILFARFIAHKVSGENDERLKDELKILKNELLRLWEIENRIVGSEIFAGRVEKMIECM